MDGGKSGQGKTPIFYDVSENSMHGPEYVVEETGQVSVRERKNSKRIKDFLKHKGQQRGEEKMKEVMLLEEESNDNQDMQQTGRVPQSTRRGLLKSQRQSQNGGASVSQNKHHISGSKVF